MAHDPICGPTHLPVRSLGVIGDRPRLQLLCPVSTIIGRPGCPEGHRPLSHFANGVEGMMEGGPGRGKQTPEVAAPHPAGTA